jgi:hypothetical protein
MTQSEDGDRVLAEDGPPKNRLVLRLTHYGETCLLDIRNWYLDKKTSEFRPTRKGISLSRRNFLWLKRVVDDKSEEILDWLSISYVPENVAAYEERQAQRNAELELESPAVEVDTREERRDVSFFHVTRSGSKATVTLNTAHPFVIALFEALPPADNTEIKELLAHLLLCHAEAAEGLSDAPATHASVLLDQLTHDWSRLLQRAAKVD